MAKRSKTMSVCIIMLFLFASLSYGETVKIIAEDAWYPFSGRQEGGVAGISVDLVRESFKAEGIDVAFDAMNYDRGMSLVAEGMAVGCFDGTRTSENENVYLWTDEPLFTNNDYFYSRADDPGTIASVADLAGKKIGLTQGYEYGDAIDLHENLNKEYSLSDAVILKKLLAGRVDVIILTEKTDDYLIHSGGYAGKCKRGGVSATQRYYVVFSKSHLDGKKYRDVFSRGFRKIKTSGTYQRIMSQWEARLKSMSATTAPAL